MSETTPVIGSVQISQGAYIVPKTPSDFGFPGDDPRAANIRYDTSRGWLITTEGITDTYLPEGQTFQYAQDIDVDATWLKKVETIIWLDRGDSTDQQNLTPFVHVTNPDGTAGTEPGPSPNNLYAFFPDNHTTVKFSVDTQTDNQIVVGDNRYRFIGWSEMQPQIFATATNPFHWCSGENPHYHQNIQFNSDCLKQEYATFIKGGAVEIIVKTNDPDGTPECKGWNNKEKVKFTIFWNDNNHTTYTHPFNSLPVLNTPQFGSYIIPSQNPNASADLLLNSFHCETASPEINSMDGYDLQGWYIGDFVGFDTTEFANLQDNPNYVRGYISQTIFPVSTPIVITAVYMPSSNQHTITYHSGLPE